jgi:hypothetical protein
MTIAELGLATKSAATLSASTTVKTLVYHGPGKRAWKTSLALPSRIRATLPCGLPIQGGLESVVGP